MDDSPEIRALLSKLVPEVRIVGVASPSGQRVVYFAVSSGGPEKTPAGDVVLKVSGGLSATSIAYLQREIELLNRIRSPYFPKLHYNEVFSVDPESEDPLPERLFVTIEERIDGLPLNQMNIDFSSEGGALYLMNELVVAVSHIWNLKPPMVHRDLKPANILIRPDRSVCVIDLGIVREEGAKGHTFTHAPFGPCTPAYSTPEQARNDKQNITFKTDIFAIGTIIYELVSGSNPFAPSPGMPYMDILSNVLMMKVPPLRSVSVVSEEFSMLIERMMEKEPYKRPRSPTALVEDIASIRGRRL